MIDKIIQRLEEAKKRTLILIEPVATTSNRIIIESAYDCAIGIVKQVAEEDGWIKCSDRLPNQEEYNKNDGRFIVTDGNRVYQALFDIYETNKFCNSGFNIKDLQIDNRPIAWQPLPKLFKGRD